MQAGDGGISNTVEVRGFLMKTSQELMEMYFENSRRSGGGDVEEVKIRDEVAYITFKEAEVAQKVASRSNHQVDGQTLTVTLFHPLPPKPCYQNKVLIQGINNAITEELLRNFLEKKMKAQVTEFLYGEEDGNVVVTFSDNIDIVQLGKIFQESSVEGVFLRVARVAISNCILVQNLHPSTSHDVILYYFESKRRSGGGDIERVEMKTEERYCLIYFEDPSVIDRVLGKSHNVDGVDFEIHLHHECLGQRSSRKKSDTYLRMSSPGNKDSASLEDENTDNQEKDKTSSSVSSNPEKESDFVEVQEWQENDGNNCTLPLWIKYKRVPDKKIIKCMKNIPCSWNFHLFWNFYTKTEPGKQMLHEILNKYSCSVAVFAEDEDLFLFEISEMIFEQESDVVQLIHVVLDSVHKCAQQFLYLENILVDQRIQGDVLQVVRQRKELDIARFELMGQQDFDALCVICTEKDQTLVLHVVTEIIHMVKECFENHEETIHVDYKWQKVMKTFGYLQKLCHKYPSVTIISDKTETAIMLKGPRDQSKPAADHFLELLGTVTSEVQEEIFSPGCQFEIFTYPEMCGYIDTITMELSIVWIPNHQTKKIHLFSKRSEKIKGVDKLIRGCVQERLYPLAKDQTVFSTKMFRSIEELKKMHTGKMVFSSSHKGLLLTTTDDIFESIDDAVQEIISKETVSELQISKVHEEAEGDRTKSTIAEKGQFPKQSNENEVRGDTTCLENSEVFVSKELMEETEKRSPEDIMKRYNAFIEYKTCSIKGELESVQKLEGHLRNLNGGYVKEAVSPVTDEEEDEFVSLPQEQTVENISQVKYQIFKHFFNDMFMSLLQEEIDLNFSLMEKVLYVRGEDQEAVDKATEDIRRAFDEINNFHESDLSIKKEQFEYAKQLMVEMNSSFPERKVYCYIHDGDPFTIHVTARKLEEVENAKRKMGIQLETFVPTSEKKTLDSTPLDKNDTERSASVSSKSLHPGDTTKSFKTAEGIKVFVYKGSILQAKVNVIVNAANEDLKHEVGVAKVIADAAGSKFIEECKTYIKNDGLLSVGTVCATSGGRLKFPFVIHAVGPRWDKYSKTSEGLQKCKEDLLKTVIGCFFKAETLQVQSIALPAISSGKRSGVPMEICALQYLQAVLKFSKAMKDGANIKEIHFIDVNDAILDLVTLSFSAALKDNKAASEQFGYRLKKAFSTFKQPSSQQSPVSKIFGLFPKQKKEGGPKSEKVASRYIMDKKKTKFNFSEILTVLIYIGDITESKCEAIVSSEDQTFKSQSGVAKAIRLRAGQKFDACIANYRGQLRKVGDLIEADAGNLKCEKVICCVVPMWNSRMSDEEYRKQLEQCLKNIIEKSKTFLSVAIPLIGTGLKDASIEICGKVLLESLLRFSGAHRSKETIREVHIINPNAESIACVKRIFMDYFDEQKKLDAESGQPGYIQRGSATSSERQNPPPPKSGITEDMASFNLGPNQPPGAQKMDRGKNDKQDICVICMWPLKDPVKLKKCNHVFCKGCVDNQMKHKPVCSTCNTIYGIITGDQPDGRMTEYIDNRHCVAGYEECGIIVITYNIPDGFERDDHHKRGKPYKGLKKTAYLPNNNKGQKVLKLLHLAFDRRLIFTIGQSQTSGKDYVVTWNGILHKTRADGGPDRYGYPDPTYLDRVLQELAAKGVTEDSISKDRGTSSAYDRVVP